MEDVLHKEFYTVVYQDLARRSKQGLLHQVRLLGDRGASRDNVLSECCKDMLGM